MWSIKAVILLQFGLFISAKNVAQELPISAAVKEKVDKALMELYKKEGLQLKAFDFSRIASDETVLKLKGHLFEVIDQQAVSAYLFVDQASSMKNVFDYLVIFNTKWVVEKTKVLVYREQHGRQIGTPRWLDQFKGMELADRPQLGKEIDGISGATISARNMTIAIHELLASLATLKEKGGL